MATKWNGFLYRPWTKALAFIMGLLMAAGGVFLCAQTLQKKSIYPEDIFARRFTDTREFIAYVSNVAEQAAQMTQRFISEETVKDGTAFAPEKRARLAQLEKDIVMQINGCKEMLRNNPDDYYTYRDNSWYTVEDGKFAVDEAAIRAELTEQAQRDILDMQTQLRQEYNRAKQALSREHSLRYAVVDWTSGRVCTNMDAQDYKAAVEAMSWYAWNENGYYSDFAAARAGRLLWLPNGAALYVGFDEAAALASGELDGLGQKAQDFKAFTKTRPVLFAAVALLLLLCCLDAVYLIGVTGRQEKGGAIHLRRADRIWNFIHWLVGLVGGGGLLLLEIALIDNAGLYGKHMSISILSALSALLPLTLIGETVLSIARHAKNKTVLKNTLWYKAWQKLRGIRPRSMKRNTLLILLGLVLWNLLSALVGFASIGSYADEFGLLISVVMLLAGGVAAYFLLLRYAASLDDIKNALRKMRQGNFEPMVLTANLPASMQDMAEWLCDIRQGLDAAVRQAVAGERMRTELITNVSHDLKTPLTSVINYVDLLRREDITEGERGDYLLTLAQKSEQLGRLVEDLVEASKASSGNVELHPVEVNLHELALQAVGETSDALAAQGIELIIQAPERAPVVWADSQKTWRIIENLMGNVKKYTMPGTRVYLQLACEDGFGGLVIKNISRAPLNIPAEELTQRFVRGDMARTGEGSGLGLSIADSLCKVQGGRFELQVDGDLFKAGMWLPEAPR